MSYLHEFLQSKGPTSGYLASNPYGGKYCMKLEAEWKAKFGVKYAVAVNSATSGLLASCMAAEVDKHTSIITTPYTMSATAAAPAVLGAKIIFGDIEPESLCLSPQSVIECLERHADRTKAVIATNLFGYPAKLHELREICDDHGLYLIEDNSQAILAKEKGRYTGTIGHMGVFSLNVHKHIQTGEGGIIVTNDPELDRNLRGAMNHGEQRGLLPGLNLRMTEITAAMALDQLREVDKAVAKARYNASSLIRIIGNDAILLQPFMADRHHAFYCLAVVPYESHKDFFVEMGAKPYVELLYKLPAFNGKFSCPVAETVSKTVKIVELCHNPQIERFIDEKRT